MNIYKEDCIYNNFKSNIFIYLILNFVTGNIYYLYFQFKITWLFKYSEHTKEIFESAKTHLIITLVSGIFTLIYVIIAFLIILFADTYELSSLAVFIPIIAFLISFTTSITWAFKIREAIRVYNINKYNIDYTANGFFTFFCPGIVFIWAIENTPNEAKLKSIKRKVN